MRYRSHRHLTSVAQQDSAPTDSTWTGGWEKTASKATSGFAQNLHLRSRQKPGSFHHHGQRVCPDTVTSELSSSWTAAGGSNGLSST